MTTQNPLNISFIVDTADSGKIKDKDTNRLIEYFLSALTVPEQDLWVNLSPYEQDRIVPRALGQTAMGPRSARSGLYS